MLVLKEHNMTFNPNALVSDSNGNLVFADNEQIRLGDDTDFVLSHNGVNSILNNSVGNLQINGATLGEVVFNEVSDDVNFRVRSAVSDSIFVQGTDGFVGIGTASPDTLLTVGGDTKITGNLIIEGTTTAINTESLLISDNHLYLNSSHTNASPLTGGLVVNYLPTTTTDTVGGNYTAGEAGVSNATVVTVGSDTFVLGDLIQFTNSSENNGLYEVLSHIGTLLTIRGVGLTTTVEDFTQNQFNLDGNDDATITKVTVSVLRAGTDGIWETGAGSSTGLAFNDLSTSATSTSLQNAYEIGNTITTNPLGGNFSINGTENFIVDGYVGVDFSTSGNITQSGTGQVSFSGNVDALAGLNVNGGLLNVSDGALFTGESLQLEDDVSLNLGTGSALSLTHNGTDSVVSNTVGSLQLNGADSSEVAFNTSGFDVDFRVQSSVGTSNLLVQGNSGFVGINATALNSTLNVGGSVSYQVNIETDVTLDSTHFAVLVNADIADRVINLPPVSGLAGRVYHIKKIDSSNNIVTINPDGAEIIDGASTQTLNVQFQSVSLISDGTQWFIL
jgi:hypothetical protein